MRSLVWAGLAGFSIAQSSGAIAGDTPLYQAAPSWVVKMALPESAKLRAGPSTVLFDAQQRIENEQLTAYIDSAARVDSAELLAQFSTLAFNWAPDKGDLIVHELSIIRGTEQIDLLAKGQKFTVLRREQALEQRELTGILTATLAPEGLQVGDILRIRMSITSKDAALGGRVQSVLPLVAAPARIGTARMILSWPTAAAPHWKVSGEGVVAKPVATAGYSAVTLPLPLAKQPEMPADAPVRFNHPPFVELSTFADWADVSKVMAPLYATEGLVAVGSPLAAEIDAIAKADPTPVGRAQRALELVQDKIRYLAVGMDGGNYIPQPPAKTWNLRYGDCKAKTILLLTILHRLGIDAEPVLAHVGMGDLVASRLPAAQAFNHVLVRASIAGESLWLDGTANGSRLADIHDTPAFRSVLPVRTKGAELMTIEAHANTRAAFDLTIDADESTSIDLPSAFDAKAIVRGVAAVMLTEAKSKLGEKEQRQAVGGFFQAFLGEAQFDRVSIDPDPASGAVTLMAHGVVTTPWVTDGRKRKRYLSQVINKLAFAPDRSRATWAAIPAAAAPPNGLHYSLRVRLPAGGKGFALEGAPQLNATIAANALKRSTKLDGGVAALDERIDTTGVEVPAAQIPIERDRVTTAKGQAPYLLAPADTLRRWDIGASELASSSQIKSILQVFAKAIENDPDEVTGYNSRASFLNGIGQWRRAIEDVTKAIAITPTEELYLQRAGISYELGDLKSALSDAEAARQLDPSSSDAIGRVAFLRAEQGDLKAATKLIDDRIALGGEMRTSFGQMKASLLGEFGDPAESVKLYDALIAETPGSEELLNARCWMKGTRNFMLDSALGDCTRAIELSSDSFASLDSRALVFFRLGKFDDALRDLDANLASNPGLAPSHFMRGVVLNRLHRGAEAAKSLATARRIEPSVDRNYLRYGIKP